MDKKGLLSGYHQNSSNLWYLAAGGCDLSWANDSLARNLQGIPGELDGQQGTLKSYDIVSEI